MTLHRVLDYTIQRDEIQTNFTYFQNEFITYSDTLPNRLTASSLTRRMCGNVVISRVLNRSAALALLFTSPQLKASAASKPVSEYACSEKCDSSSSRHVAKPGGDVIPSKVRTALPTTLISNSAHTSSMIATAV